jgi:catechol 2,3-dioxygenase-like lactoylglutathione lyase family enzyme
LRRFHVNLSVNDLSESIRFYTALFAMEPTVRKEDYAKWMLEDPRINFAIAQRGQASGVNHLGFQVDSAEELTAMRAQLRRADQALIEQTGAACCYANSDKYWITDPEGIAWETFHTLNAIPIYGADPDIAPETGACCAPLTAIANDPCGEPEVASAGRACCAS